MTNDTTLPGGAEAENWRRWLLRKIGWLLLVKLAALILLKSLFFSGEHRPQITPSQVGTQLSLPSDGIDSSPEGNFQ